ncbi:MAG: hypothetical protein LBV12_11085 [Puniceicoccales bacterium]|jgi:hypothetical protein|nr:hypothetical protein [Puniceicoccales bacterium]
MNEMGSKNYLGGVTIGDKNVTTDGEIGDWTFNIAGKDFDFNPTNEVSKWSGSGWVKASITVVIGFTLFVILFKTIQGAQRTLQVQSEIIGNTNASVTFLGLGVTSTSIAALTKLAIYGAIVATLAVTIWAIGASYGVVPTLSGILFSDGAPAFAWAFFNVFLPMELIGTAPITAVLIKFFGWGAAMVSSMVMKAASTI